MAGSKRDEQAHPSNGYDRPSRRYDCVQEEETGRVNIETWNIDEEQELQHLSPNGNARGQEEEPGRVNIETWNIDEEQELQDLSPNGNARGQEEEPDNMQNSRCSKLINFFVVYWHYIIVTAVIAFGAGAGFCAVVFFRVSQINKTTLNPDGCKLLLAASEHGRRPCPTDWIGYQTKCFHFSDKEETWSSSKHFCSLYNASLGIIEKEEMDFVRRYKGSIPHWIGLCRDPKQPWTWVNGSVSTWEVLGDGGDCAYLNDEGKASSSRCSTLHHWICSKPEEFTSPKIG